MQQGETVLIIGATGTAGKLAIAAAKLAGTRRIVAAGRRQEILAALGVNATVDLNRSGKSLCRAFAEAAGLAGYDAIIDCIWGEPTQAVLATLVGHNLSRQSVRHGHGVRPIDVGSIGAPDITLATRLLRSGDLHIMGSGTGNFPLLPVLQQTVVDILLRTARREISVRS